MIAFLHGRQSASGRVPRFGLSAKLLLLSVVFVMVAEVLIFTPSIGRFRESYLMQRLANGHLATLALDATPDNVVSEELALRLLALAEVRGVVLRAPDEPTRALSSTMPPNVDLTTDLDNDSMMELALDAVGTLTSSGNRVLRVIGRAPQSPDITVEVLVDERPLRKEMLAYAKRILLLGAMISLITAVLLYTSLRWLIVRPLQRVTASIATFRRDPEAPGAALKPGGRGDEIGIVEHELSDMQRELQQALHQKTNLATLGTGVAKINHDLRNMLTTAQLLSDYLGASDDPKVRKVAPTLMSAIDRAAALCTDTLRFATGQPEPQRQPIALDALLREVGAEMRPARNGDATPVDWVVAVDPGVTVRADRDQLYRALANVGRNAFQAGATRVEVTARREAGRTLIDLADNGPGLPPRARDNLFRPFAASARPGGTGLGLAIARDLMRGHGGDVELLQTGATGTTFRLVLPDGA